ncbi:MAG: GMP/IMP nucleotidase [Pseudomonadota bacterium]
MIDWNQIDTVLLDMDGTLLDLHYDNYFWQQHVPRRYAQIHRQEEAIAVAEVSQRINNARGTLAWYCLDHWSEQLKLDIPALKREIAHMIEVRPFVEDFLSRIRGANKKLVLVTNAHRTGLELKLSHTGIARWFDNVVVSHDYKVAKEELAFWHRLHATHPFTPTRTLLIDDNEAVLSAANQYGIAHLLTLLQPDSKADKRLSTRFPGIHHFDEIMPEVH